MPFLNEQQFETVETALKVAKNHATLIDTADTLRAGVQAGSSPMTRLFENALAVLEEAGTIIETP